MMMMHSQGSEVARSAEKVQTGDRSLSCTQDFPRQCYPADPSIVPTYPPPTLRSTALPVHAGCIVSSSASSEPMDSLLARCPDSARGGRARAGAGAGRECVPKCLIRASKILYPPSLPRRHATPSQAACRRCSGDRRPPDDDIA